MLGELNLLLIVGVLALGVVGVAFGVTLVQVRNERRALRALTAAAARLAAGEWRALPAEKRSDEVGALARALAALSTHWQTRLATLEEQVAAQAAGVERQTARVEAAARVSQQIATALTAEEWLNATVRHLSEQLGFYHVGLFLLDESRQTALLRAASSTVGRHLLEEGYKVTLAESADFSAVLAQGQCLMASLPLFAPEDFPFPQTRAEALFPLRAQGDVIGVLDVHSEGAGAFVPEQCALLQMLADELSLIWRTAHIQATTEAQINEINRLLRTQGEEEWGRLTQERQQWGYGYDGIEVKAAAELDLGDRPPSWVLALRGGREAMGELKIFADADALNSDDLDLARAVVDEAGRAMESARLFSKMQTALEEVGVLYRCSQALGVARSEEQVLRAFVDYLIAPEIDRCALALIEPGTAGPGALVRLGAAWDAGKARSPLLGDRWEVAKIPAMAQTTTTVLAVDDIAVAPHLDETSRQVYQEILRLRAFILVPLVAGGQLWGWLLAAAQRTPYHFTERERRVYRSLADQAALVLQSIHLIEEMTQRAARERRVTDITAQIRRHTDVDTILQTAIRELGRSLRASDGLIRLGLGESRQIRRTQPLHPPADVEDNV
ncbi:MAG TPA: GAF domain-containing protein [Anaerolineae bacterium]|nr:GAF domain-containing protein [Anaerolineae bacterium]